MSFQERTLSAAERRPAPTEGTSGSPWSAAWPDPKARNRMASHVVYGESTNFQWTGSGNLSVKTVFGGHATIESGGGIHRIEPKSYLVLNQEREYTFRIDSRQPVRAFSVFFDAPMIRSAVRTYRATTHEQLDDPFRSIDETIEFFERRYDQDGVAEHLQRMHDDLPAFRHDPLWVQENMFALFDLLLKGYHETWNEVDEVQAVRAVTKEELYRRLYKAKDYAYATLDQPVSLDDLAYVACLSTNYFLRSFKALFRQTPHQFIIERRLDRAQTLLRQTDMSVSEVCLAIGFQSLGSFSWLFKKRIGASPEQFRRNYLAGLAEPQMVRSP